MRKAAGEQACRQHTRSDRKMRHEGWHDGILPSSFQGRRLRCIHGDEGNKGDGHKGRYHCGIKPWHSARRHSRHDRGRHSYRHTDQRHTRQTWRGCIGGQAENARRNTFPRRQGKGNRGRRRAYRHCLRRCADRGRIRQCPRRWRQERLRRAVLCNGGSKIRRPCCYNNRYARAEPQPARKHTGDRRGLCRLRGRDRRPGEDSRKGRPHDERCAGADNGCALRGRYGRNAVFCGRVHVPNGCGRAVACGKPLP